MIEKWKDRLEGLPYSPSVIACFFGFLTFLLRLPFVFRYDLFFGSDPGICYLMPLRILRGEDRPFYFYSESHQGATESYLTAVLFKLFGPSIPLAAAQSLLLWSVAVGLGVYLLIRATSRFHGFLGGLIAAIGVPYTLVYVSVPYIGYPGSFMITMLVLVQVFRMIEKGPSNARFFWFGLAIGTGMFVGKQCIPGVAAALAALALFKTPSYDLHKAFRPLGWLLAALGFLLGYWPEILYRATHAHYRDFSKIAGPALLWQNMKQVPKGLMAYFDAHPFSRIPTDVYFYHGIPYWGVRCGNALDVLFVIIGLSVLFFIGQTLLRAYRGKNVGLFLFTSLVCLNLVAVTLSTETVGNIFNARRYMHTSAITFSLLTGYFFTYHLLKPGKGLWKGLLLGLAVLFPLRAAFDEFALLGRPDSLREIRWVIQDMQQKGYDRGISYYGPNYTINALSNERIIIGGREEEPEMVPEYAGWISQADRIAVVGFKEDPVEDQVAYNGNTYQRIGNPRVDVVFRWVPYRKIQQPPPGLAATP